MDAAAPRHRQRRGRDSRRAHCGRRHASRNRPAFSAQAALDRPDALISPGLINTHTHAAMSLLRGIADDLQLQDWLEKYIFPAEAKNVTPDFVRWGTRLACLEMMLSGTTTFVDMYYFEDRVAETAKECGMRGVLGETIIGFPSPDAKTPADSLRFTEKFLEQFQGDPLITAAVAPHAIYTNSDETLSSPRSANRFSAPLVIHLSETRRENDETLAKRAKTPTAALDALGVFNGRTLAAHAVWTDDTDLRILRERGTGIAHCPSSNMKLASGVAPVVKMLTLGSMGRARHRWRGRQQQRPQYDGGDGSGLQTAKGHDRRSAGASGATGGRDGHHPRGARPGSRQGNRLARNGQARRPDHRAARPPHAVPLYDVYSQMVYALKGSDIRDVMVNGRLWFGTRSRSLSMPGR